MAKRPEETFGQLLGLGKSWRAMEARLEAETSTFVLKVEETPELWPEESARVGTPVSCHDHVEPMRWRHLDVFNKECVTTARSTESLRPGQAGALCHARQGRIGLGGLCCGTNSVQRTSQSHPARGHLVQNLEDTINKSQEHLVQSRKRLADLNGQVDQPFEYATRLAELAAKQQELVEKLDLNRNSAPATEEDLGVRSASESNS